MNRVFCCKCCHPSVVHRRQSKSNCQITKTGFTLPEMMVVMVIAGILVSITAVSWRSFWNGRVLTAAQDQVLQAMREAQADALRTHSTWQINFRESEGTVQWTVHPATVSPAQATWFSLNSGIHIDPDETTLPRRNGIYRVEFNERGNTPPPFGRITFTIENGGRLKRCVFTSTLLGVLRKGRNHDRPRDGKYCY
ncbi:MAG: type II secretion system protein [Cyanobacteria bacterium CRU_2_1]|nr:type II secretion system protein [Cyanobacteria bacterium RU_5_0]NJR61080.1 type II secretion system protein [Cyanobacteria bacterium CRU_2_1]